MNEKITRIVSILCGLSVGIGGYSFCFQDIDQIQEISLGSKSMSDYREEVLATNSTGKSEIGKSEDKPIIKSTRTTNSEPKNISQGEIQHLGSIDGINTKYLVKGFPKDSIATRVVNKSFALRGIDWTLTLMGENGSFKVDKQSDCNSNGIREHSYGFCQLAQKYHAPFIWNTGYTLVGKTYVVNEAVVIAGGHTTGFMNWETQLDYCTSVWDDAKRKGTMPFNAYRDRWSQKHRLIEA